MHLSNKDETHMYFPSPNLGRGDGGLRSGRPPADRLKRIVFNSSSTLLEFDRLDLNLERKIEGKWKQNHGNRLVVGDFNGFYCGQWRWWKSDGEAGGALLRL